MSFFFLHSPYLAGSFPTSSIEELYETGSKTRASLLVLESARECR